MPLFQAIPEAGRESRRYSGTALERLRVRFEERLGKPMGLCSETSPKSIGRANSARGNPKYPVSKKVILTILDHYTFLQYCGHSLSKKRRLERLRCFLTMSILVGRFARIDSRFEKSSFAHRPSKKWDSSEDWTQITRISMRIGEKKRFARIWPSASKLVFLCESTRANLRNVGVQIACPLMFFPIS